MTSGRAVVVPRRRGWSGAFVITPPADRPSVRTGPDREADGYSQRNQRAAASGAATAHTTRTTTAPSRGRCRRRARRGTPGPGRSTGSSLATACRPDGSSSSGKTMPLTSRSSEVEAVGGGQGGERGQRAGHEQADAGEGDGGEHGGRAARCPATGAGEAEPEQAALDDQHDHLEHLDHHDRGGLGAEQLAAGRAASSRGA